MEKFCIFCGQRPESKNLEHILPYWLLEATGDPNRTGKFGLKKTSDPSFRYFSFSSFKFPACTSCNSFFSDLEGKASQIIKKMLNLECLSAFEITNLLDWFDKVRVGLWLANLSLDKTIHGIIPKYHISKRIRYYDRALFVSYSSDDVKRLTAVSTDCPCFMYNPTCFGLMINNLCFMNTSYNLFISKRLGYPYLENAEFIPGKQEMKADFIEGTGKIKEPILRFKTEDKYIKIFQSGYGHIKEMDSEKSKYESEWVRKTSIEGLPYVSKPFVETPSKTGFVDSIDFSELAKLSDSRARALQRLNHDVFRMQRSLNMAGFKYHNLPEPEKKIIEEVKKACEDYAHDSIENNSTQDYEE